MLFPSKLVRIAAVLAAAVFMASFSVPLLAQDASVAKATSPTPEQEAKFIATLTNAKFKGRWCSYKDGELGPEKEDTYNVVSITKMEGDKWKIVARMSYGGKSLDIPIPTEVKWAGDTPVLVLNGVSLGAKSAYSARVMIYEKTYSGWWSAMDHGGLLNGVIVNEAK